MNKTKYIAIKIKGLNHYIWFDQSEVIINDDGRFIGEAGWGKDSA